MGPGRPASTLTPGMPRMGTITPRRGDSRKKARMTGSDNSRGNGPDMLPWMEAWHHIGKTLRPCNRPVPFQIPCSGFRVPPFYSPGSRLLRLSDNSGCPFVVGALWAPPQPRMGLGAHSRAVSVLANPRSNVFFYAGAPIGAMEIAVSAYDFHRPSRGSVIFGQFPGVRWRSPPGYAPPAHFGAGKQQRIIGHPWLLATGCHAPAC